MEPKQDINQRVADFLKDQQNIQAMAPTQAPPAYGSFVSYRKKATIMWLLTRGLLPILILSVIMGYWLSGTNDNYGYELTQGSQKSNVENDLGTEPIPQKDSIIDDIGKSTTPAVSGFQIAPRNSGVSGKLKPTNGTPISNSPQTRHVASTDQNTAPVYDHQKDEHALEPIKELRLQGLRKLAKDFQSFRVQNSTLFNTHLGYYTLPFSASSIDRLGMTISGAIARTGHYQVETGFSWSEVRTENDFEGLRTKRDIVLNRTRIRYGLSPRIELNASWNWLKTQVKLEGELNYEGTRVFPFEIGARYLLTNPNMANKHVSVDFSISQLQKLALVHLVYKLRVNAHYELGRKLSFQANFGTQRGRSVISRSFILNTKSGARDYDLFYAFRTGYLVHDKLYIFGEVAGDLHFKEVDAAYANLGLAYDLSPKVKVDAFFGKGLNSPATCCGAVNYDVIFGFGASFLLKLPKPLNIEH